MSARATPELDPHDTSVPEAKECQAPPQDVRRSAVRNTVAQVVGRILTALGRLVVARLIIRGLGKEVFGGYSLVIVLLSIAEWLLDFGVTDVFVREVCREPARRARLLRILTGAKLIQIPLAVLGLAAAVFALGYPAEIVRAAMAGSMSLIFFGGVLAYRVVFRESLTIERDVAAELLSTLAMIGLTALVPRFRGDLASLLLCYTISRMVFLGLCVAWGKSSYLPSVRGVTKSDLIWAFKSSGTIGAIGLLVAIYEGSDVILLSRLSRLSEVASYSGAQRFIWPFITCLTAIGGTLYTLVARYWPHSRGEFEAACQRGMDVGLALTGLAVAPILAAPDFLLGLIGPGMLSAAPVLRVLGLILFAKALSMTLGPVLYVLNAPRRMLAVVILALVLKVGLIALLSSRFGATGVAFAALSADSAAACSSIYFVCRFSGYRPKWGASIKTVIISFVPMGTLGLLRIHGFAAAVCSVLMYGAFIFASGAVSRDEVLAVIRRRGA
jgi:O-antigen/teichoic acid export membrane protein